MLDSKWTELLGCFITSTLSSFESIIQSKTNPTIPTTTNNAALTIPANIACLRCVTFVHGFPPAALPGPLSRHGFISAERRLSETFGRCSVEAF
jgi:hypothetical protein